MSMLRLASIFVLAPLSAFAQGPTINAESIARIDSLFRKYNRADSPGCALGISQRDTIALERAWGSAQLEFGIPITPATKFEAGSVSKQFTAAAVLRLAQLGRLSLDDDVRKYVPEIPRYEQVVTIRNLIHHTSGLRDWGTVMTVAGWPRGTRTYSHAHVLDILSRQQALNYPVGSEYLYSNSNYNLLAIIAERVSGQSLADFTRKELFEPLGMTNTSWRDDYARVVLGRAQAYSAAGSTWRLQMPFENVYGNSSLITTVGDLLKWSANLSHMRLGGADFVASQLRRGKLTTGREISYAGGLFVTEEAGRREIWHDGATAGYRAFLARYPETGLAIALLCNAGDVDPSQIARQVAAIVSPPRPPIRLAARDTIGLTVATDRLALLAGNYRSVRSDEALRLAAAGQRLRQVDGPTLIAVSDREFTSPSGRTHMLFDSAPSGQVSRIRVWVDDGDTTAYVPAGAPAIAGLREYEGTYSSSDAEVELAFRVEKDTLVLSSRPSTRLALNPVYRDGFTARGSTFRFTRAGNGRVDGFHLTSGRVRRLRFDRVSDKAPAPASIIQSR
jgi:CubicO group peptidase (beta-lactamase class C family)